MRLRNPSRGSWNTAAGFIGEDMPRKPLYRRSVSPRSGNGVWGGLTSPHSMPTVCGALVGMYVRLYPSGRGMGALAPTAPRFILRILSNQSPEMLRPARCQGFLESVFL